MSFVNRFLHRKPSHEEWLAAHPGKSVTHEAQAHLSPEEQERMRRQMENELNADRAKRATGK